RSMRTRPSVAGNKPALHVQCRIPIAESGFLFSAGRALPRPKKTTGGPEKCSNYVESPEVPMSPVSPRSILIATATFLLASLPAFSDSQVRSVRLSYVEGGVQTARSGGQFDGAMVNLPITQNTELRTNDDGRAEVEFEDGSTLRIAPNTSIEFPQL